MADRPRTAVPERPAQFARAAGGEPAGSNGAGSNGAGNGRPPWADVEGMLDEAAALAAADLPPGTFAAAFLNRLVRGTGAAGAVLWDRTGDGPRTTLTPAAAERPDGRGGRRRRPRRPRPAAGRNGDRPAAAGQPAGRRARRRG